MDSARFPIPLRLHGSQGPEPVVVGSTGTFRVDPQTGARRLSGGVGEAANHF